MRFPLKLSAAAEIVGGLLVGNDLEVQGVCIDSRTADAGCLFVALSGGTHDGHAFVTDARARGAVAALVSDASTLPEGMPGIVASDPVAALSALALAVRKGFAGPVVGITGSVGKTTTKELVHTVLGAAFAVHATAGNRNNELGLPLTLLSTPENTDLLVLEMGMRGLGQIKHLCSIAAPAIGIVTGIGVSHIELLGSRERIADAKSELLEALPTSGTAIFPVSDPFFTRLAQASSHCSRLTTGIDLDADVVGRDLQRHRGGWRFTAETPWGRTKCLLPSPARFLVSNALFALAAAGVCGMELDTASRALGRFTAPAGRLSQRQALSGALVIDDTYNAAPESMVAALEVLAETPVGAGGVRIAVLGEMRELGEHAVDGHTRVGEAVARVRPDMLVVVGEGARRIEAVARVEGFPPERIHWFADVAAVNSMLPAIVGASDVVMAKGSRAVGLDALVRVLCAEPEAAS